MKSFKFSKLSDIASISYGKGLLTKDLKKSGFPVFGANGTIGYFDKYLYERPKLLISCRGAYSGTPNMSPKKCFITNNSLIINFSNESYETRKFYYYFFQTLNKDEYVTGTAQPQVTINKLKDIIVPLAELMTQKKIVTKIDSLFADIDAGLEKINEVRAKLELYKQSVLQVAFTYKEDIRGNGLICLKDLCTIDYGKALPEKKRVDGTTLVFGSSGQIGSHNISMYSEPIVVVGRKGNISGIFKVDGDSWVIDTAYALLPKVNSNLSRDFLFYFLKHQSKHLISCDQSTAIPSLSREILYSLKLPMLSLDYQLQVVKSLNKFFFEINNLDEQMKAASEQYSLLKQSILKQAFEGNLV